MGRREEYKGSYFLEQEHRHLIAREMEGDGPSQHRFAFNNFPTLNQDVQVGTGGPRLGPGQTMHQYQGRLFNQLLTKLMFSSPIDNLHRLSTERDTLRPPGHNLCFLPWNFRS